MKYLKPTLIILVYITVGLVENVESQTTHNQSDHSNMSMGTNPVNEKPLENTRSASGYTLLRPRGRSACTTVLESPHRYSRASAP